jgi:hypothetical protein
VTAGIDVRAVVDAIGAIDHHAHLLARPGTPFGLTDLLTESREPAQVAAGRDHPAFHRAVRNLAAVLEVDPTEAAVTAALDEADGAALTRTLLDASGIEAMFVDDGFRFPGALALADHMKLVGRPVRRIVRLETEVEAAAGQGDPSFVECVTGFRAAVARAVAHSSVALKTIAAYRCGLDLPVPDAVAASAAYDGWRRSGSRRLTDPALIVYFLAEALALTRERQVPLQIHTGFGDADGLLTRSDPALLQPHIDHGMLTGVPVVLLHCHPFVHQASYLAGVYEHVHLDLSLAMTLAPHLGPALLLDALGLAPATKVLFATDASRRPELFFLGARWWRDSLVEALNRLIDGGFADGDTAARWAGLILAGNACRLYDYDGTG